MSGSTARGRRCARPVRRGARSPRSRSASATRASAASAATTAPISARRQPRPCARDDDEEPEPKVLHKREDTMLKRIACLAAVAALGLGAAVAPQAQDKVRVSFNPQIYSWLPIFLAIDKGYFKG